MTKFKWFLVVALSIPFIIIATIYHDSRTLFVIGSIELLCIAVVVNTFVIVYWRRNWKVNAYGRALMYSKISLALLANLSVITGFLGPDWQYRSVVRLVLFAGILVAQTRLLQLLFSLRNKTAREEYHSKLSKEYEKEVL